MTYRVNHVNKKTGVTYVYESTSFWDKTKKQARSKQVCIGKIDPATGFFLPSKRLSREVAVTKDPSVTASAEIIGPSLILDAVTKDLGLHELVKSCFPNHFQQIMTMAYYIASHGGPLSHCGTWCKGHAPLRSDALTSQRISEVLGAIDLDGRQTFFAKWTKRVLAEDYLCYDVTSISSYSEFNEYLKYGHNRDGDRLPQLNLAMLFGQKSRLPVYFQRLPGNITDVSTLHNLLKTFKAMGIQSFHYVMDKGFYSKKNVDQLFDARDKFTLSVPLNNKWVQQPIDDVYETIQGPQQYKKIDGEVLYVHTKLYPWGTSNRRCYLHLYYNAHIRARAVDQFNEDLINYKRELETGNMMDEHQEAYASFFVTKTTPKRGVKVSFNTEAISKHINRYLGFQALLTNGIKDPIDALRIYRDKDSVEKSFDDLKNQLDMKRLRMHSSTTVDGRLFVQFIALICLSALRREMRKSDLIDRYTVRELLQEMETLTKVKYSGRYGYILTEVTKPQREILQGLNIECPHT